MMCCGTYQSVVLRHDTESFFERRFLVLGSHPFVQIVDNRQVSVVQVACFLHDAYAPVEVGGETVLQVVWLYQSAAGKECLMADQHSLFETPPGQCLRGGQSSHAQEVSVFVYDGSLSVEYVGQFVAVDGMYHLLQSIVFVKAVAGVEEAEIVAGGKANSFVHCIIQPFIRFADDGLYPRPVSVDDGHSAVFGRSVYEIGRAHV